MFRPDFPALTFSAVDKVQFIVPSTSAPAATERSTFAALFGDVRAEVIEFIENGSSGPTSVALSADGRFQQARLLAAPAASAGEDGAPQAFFAAIKPLARQAGERLGVSPEVIAAHAALETGWGQRPLRQPNGSDTHNVFGLKATGGWSGQVTTAATTEYENGLAQHKSERFRSYPDAAAAFNDFAKLLLNNPRYHGALNTGDDARAYAQGLVRGGYATDPAYADKLARVAARLQSED